MKSEAWAREINEFRRQKDEFFAAGEGSPIPAQQRAGFRGLSYYAPDPAYRFEVPLRKGDRSPIVIPRTGGDSIEYVRAGVFELSFPTGDATIVGYEAAGGHRELFLPFRDSTSGTETYGAGRYLEARPVGFRKWLVDFNMAYHPFCLYNEAFTCPLPPPENWLKVPVRAGERLQG